MAPTEAAIEARAAPAADVILHGPRGNGKTVLLDVIGDRLERIGAQVVRATAHEELASWRTLANALIPDDGWRGALRRLSERAGGAVPGRLTLFGVRLDLNLTQTDGPSACCERRGDGLDARQVHRELVARGVVWARDGSYEPGNPSLLTHVAECVV